MRILVLCKRQYTGRDLLDDRYGRMFWIPACLSRRGHEMSGVTLSYRCRPEGTYSSEEGGGVVWQSRNLGLPTLRGLASYFEALGDAIGEGLPSCLWAGSDVLHCVIGWYLSRRYKIPLLLDLYDDFEAFSANRIPGLTRLFRAACRGATGISVVSEVLARKVRNEYKTPARVIVIPNGIPPAQFYPRDRMAAREMLGLPTDAKLIGTAGALSSSRGIEVLFEAFQKISERLPGLRLVVAGPRDKGVESRLRAPGVIDLGVVSPERAGTIFSALDVAVICNRISDFGNACFPQKFYEIVACNTPLVAARLGDVAELLVGRPDCTYTPGAADELAVRLEAQILGPRPVELEVPTWDALAAKAEAFMRSCL